MCIKHLPQVPGLDVSSINVTPSSSAGAENVVTNGRSSLPLGARNQVEGTEVYSLKFKAGCDKCCNRSGQGNGNPKEGTERAS